MVYVATLLVEVDAFYKWIIEGKHHKEMKMAHGNGCKHHRKMHNQSADLEVDTIT